MLIVISTLVLLNSHLISDNNNISCKQNATNVDLIVLNSYILSENNNIVYVKHYTNIYTKSVPEIPKDKRTTKYYYYNNNLGSMYIILLIFNIVLLYVLNKILRNVFTN